MEASWKRSRAHRMLYTPLRSDGLRDGNEKRGDIEKAGPCLPPLTSPGRLSVDNKAPLDAMCNIVERHMEAPPSHTKKLC